LKNNILSRFLRISIISLIVYSNIAAQKSLISLKVGMPSNFGNTFYSDWEGIVNLGFKFSNLRKKNLYLNVYFNYDRLNDSRNDWNTKQNLYKIGLGLQYKIQILESAIVFPQFGIGFVYQNLNNERFNSSTDNSGMNLLTEIDLLYKIIERLNMGIGLRYDFVQLAVPDYAGNSSYNRRIHTITPTAQVVIEL